MCRSAANSQLGALVRPFVTGCTVVCLFVRSCPNRRSYVLMFLVMSSICLLSAVLAIALVREVRLRRALEKLLRRILDSWRKFHATNPPESARRATHDPENGSNDRM